VRLFHRVALAAAGLSVPVAVPALGCGDKIGNYNDLGNEMTNHAGVTSGGSAGTGTGTGTGGSSTGPGLNLCECAVGIEGATISQACVDCANKAVQSQAMCAQQNDACTGNGPCHAAVNCVVGCQGDPSCVAGCLTSPTLSQTYVNLLTCTCNACGTLCPPPEPVVCVPPDGGLDAADAAGG
jgi:hypothetical protein